METRVAGAHSRGELGILGKRPFDLLLRRPEIGGELGPVCGLLLGGGFTPLLGFAERGLECEPGLVDGR